MTLMMEDKNLHKKNLKMLLKDISALGSIEEKTLYIRSSSYVKEVLENEIWLQSFLNELTLSGQYVLLSFIALGQGAHLVKMRDSLTTWRKSFLKLIKVFEEIEQFYSEIGGIIGYHMTFLTLLEAGKVENQLNESVAYYKPEGIDISNSDYETEGYVYEALKNLDALAEVYPVGGAGDRLQLRCRKTKELLPAACLEFNGKTLLEGLFRDLQAKEYLHYKLFGKQVNIPAILMTSEDKSNHHQIRTILQKLNWLHRKESSFYFVIQPMVPVITIEGEWLFSSPFELALKPGGHGVVWKLVREANIFAQLLENGISKVLVRQINNPMAGVDSGILAFAGVGFSRNAHFGFASCERLLGTSEGMIVLREKEKDSHFEAAIANIEYTEFVQKGLPDIAKAPGSHFSIYPSNTNILFGDIKKLIHASTKSPFPGLLVNMKMQVKVKDENGLEHEISAGRLETMMQNISETMVKVFKDRIDSHTSSDLPVFVTYNKRRKTISVTKKCFIPGKPLEETPEGCYYEQELNSYELLTAHCHMKLPPMPLAHEYIEKGPALIFHFHPALGPLWNVIGQKLRGGKLSWGSELHLEVAELDLENLELDGSLLIQSERPIGHLNEEELLQYSEESSKCELYDVKVVNKGIDRLKVQEWWRGELPRKEAVEIKLHGNAEFYAEKVTFIGSYHIEVPSGHRMIAKEKEGKIEFTLTRIGAPTWSWKYSVNSKNEIKLKKSEIRAPRT